jgi:hypothetical protein
MEVTAMDRDRKRIGGWASSDISKNLADAGEATP